MRLILILVVLRILASCKDTKQSPPTPTPASGSAPVAVIDAKPTLDVCAIGRAAVELATCPTPEVRENLVKAKKSLDGIVDTVGKAGVGDPRQFQVMCAQLLFAIERDALKVNCTLQVAQRAEIMAMLDEWYGQRTAVTPTGDAAADEVIAKIAGVRDAACECRDGACLDRLDKQLGAVGAMPESAPQAARDLGTKLLEDAARCANRVRTITDPK